VEVDDVGEQDGSHRTRLPTGRRVESGATGPVDHHQHLVALHPGHVPGRQVEHLVGADDELLTLISPYAHPSAEDHAAVVELARGGSDRGLGMLLPTPARLEDVAADHGLGQANLVGGTQRIVHDRLGLAEVADLNPAHGRYSNSSIDAS
jgi:hypothetical protein